MEIRKVEEKPAVIHKKEHTKVRTAKRDRPRQSVFHLRDKEKREAYNKDRKTGSADIVKYRKDGLYVMGRAAARKTLDQLDGGEEIRESAELMTALSSPIYHAGKKGAYSYRKQQAKKQQIRKDKERNNTEHKNKEKAGRTDKESRNSDTERRKQAVKQKEKGSSVKRKTGEGKAIKGNTNSPHIVRERMLSAFLEKLSLEQDENKSFITTLKETTKAELLLIARKLAVTLAPVFIGMFSLMSIMGLVVVLVLAVIYNSPLAIFFPLPETEYENPKTVLSGYYMEFNQKVTAMEENGDGITYQNAENGVPVSNFNDTLMVYMVLYGSGRAGYVMDDDGKANLKKVFDEMNYIDSASSAVEKQVGDSLGEVWATAYCPCSICCGPFANGITASGKTARAKHTIAVDAYNPIVPMGTKVIIEGIEYTVEDTGDLNRYGNDFDIFYAHHEDCTQWGRKKVEAFLSEGNTNTVTVHTSGTTVHNLTYKDYMNKGTMTEEEKTMLTQLMDSDLWDSYYLAAAGQAVAELAYTKIGCRYDQNRRYQECYYDCSSLVQRLYKEVGIELPATASTQGKYCYENAMIINRKDLKAGDLIFYSYKDNGEFRNISHVAIYVDGKMMIHAANESRGVVLDPLRDTHVVFYARPYK